jgi:cell volume regulation protein A
MDTRWDTVRPALGRALLLATIGVLVTAGVIAAFAHWALGVSLLEGLLLGSVVASTDAAAVFGLLRGRGINLREDVQSLLELESGCNDPMAVFLTIAVTTAIVQPGGSPGHLALEFVQEMTLGALGGFLAGKGGVYLMRRMRLDFDALYSVVSIAVVLFAYGATGSLGGSGFLAVYVAGLVYGHGDFHQRKGLRKFHDGIAWLVQIAMFLTLGLLVFPSQLAPVVGPGLATAAVLVFIARPLGVFLTMVPTRMDRGAMLLVSWTGLRGAVPIVLATYPLLAGVPKAHLLFNLVFFVVIVSALAQGTTLPWIAKRLGLRTGG